MPRYNYTAKSQPNKAVQGDIEAESEQDAINKLTKAGLFPISVKAEDLSSYKQGIRGLWKISNKDIVLFTRQLSTLVESGVNILNGLNIISNQIPSRYFKAILNDVTAKIKDGRSLSESLASHPRIFSNFYTSMVHTGEVSGTIELSLKRLADFLENEEEFKNSVRAALTYPFFIFALSALTVIILLGFVIPRLVGMFEDMGQILPLPTKILIGISAFLQGYWWVVLAAIFLAAFFLHRLYHSPQGKISLDEFKLKLPLLGKTVLKTEISRLMRTLSLLLSSGITIVSALDIAVSALDNQVLKSESQKFKDKIAGGSNFSSCLAGSKFYPAFVTNIVTIGEESGALEKSLMRIAEDYERDVDRSLKILTRMLEPIIILVMGLIVGFIVLSMLLPIFQINLIVR